MSESQMRRKLNEIVTGNFTEDLISIKFKNFLGDNEYDEYLLKEVIDNNTYTMIIKNKCACVYTDNKCNDSTNNLSQGLICAMVENSLGQSILTILEDIKEYRANNRLQFSGDVISL